MCVHSLQVQSDSKVPELPDSQQWRDDVRATLVVDQYLQVRTVNSTICGYAYTACTFHTGSVATTAFGREVLRFNIRFRAAVGMRK